MATPFATTTDVAARWRALSSTEEPVASVLLGDASDIIRSRWADVDSRIAVGTLSADSVRRVVALMVKRALIHLESDGLESRTESVGPFSTADKYANPQGNLYLTAEDVRLFEPAGYKVAARMGWLA